MRTYTYEGQTLDVQLRPFGVFLWLCVGFEVRVGGRTFLPKLDRAGFNTATEFELNIDGSRVPGVVRSLGPMWFLPRMRYSVSIAGSEIARDAQVLRRWYVSYLAWGAVFVVILLALLGALALAAAIRGSPKPPNQAMQRTASKAATDVVRICHPRFGCVAPCTGLAVADLVSR